MELLIPIVVGILVYEAYAWLPKISEWLIERAVYRLPAEDQDRCREEWKANLDTLPNTVVKLLHALSFTFCRTADWISIETFEMKFHEIDCVLKKLTEQHDGNRTAIRLVKMRAAENNLSRKNLEHHLGKLVTSGKMDEALAGFAMVEPATRQSLRNLAQALESLDHALVSAVTRAGDLMTARIQSVSARIDEADDRIKTVIEKHADIDAKFRKRKLPYRALVHALENLNDELKELSAIVGLDSLGDEYAAGIREYGKIMTAIHSATSSLRPGGPNVPRCVAQCQEALSSRRLV
jgi:nitrate reductase assembly molybdenum cofactor insertion protein NarJ